MNVSGIKIGQSVGIVHGCGFWDVTSYPYGGCFKRAPKWQKISGKVVSVVKEYGDGSPAEVRLEVSNSPFLDASKGRPSFFVVKVEHLI